MKKMYHPHFCQQLLVRILAFIYALYTFTLHLENGNVLENLMTLMKLTSRFNQVKQKNIGKYNNIINEKVTNQYSNIII